MNENDIGAATEENDEAFAARLRALAHPVRLRILGALAAADACHCGDFVRDLPLAQSTVSEHIRILREAGFVRGETGGRRPCYCLDREAVRRLAEDCDRVFAAMGGDKPRVKQQAARRARGARSRGVHAGQP